MEIRTISSEYSTLFRFIGSLKLRGANRHLPKLFQDIVRDLKHYDVEGVDLRNGLRQIDTDKCSGADQELTFEAI